MRGVLWPSIGAAVALLIATPAWASGGEHTVDDSEVETPGTCHVESWATMASDKTGVINVSPACTRAQWPFLEIGGFVSHGWTRDSADTIIGVAPKVNLRSQDRGVGIGIATSLGFSTGEGRFETASVIVPVTIPAGHRLRFNLNAGWQWFRTTTSHDLFVGAQAEFAVSPKLSLMAECFKRSSGKAGGQMGLRWTPGKGNVDFDLIGGRYVDGSTRNAVTFGITVRR